MSLFARFNLTDGESLRAELRRLGLALPLAATSGPVAATLNVGKHVLRNRFVALPMEGTDAQDDGAPGELTVRRYRRFASGGSALIWFEATAVVPEGRSSPRQLVLSDRTVDGFARLVEATRQSARQAHGGAVVCLLQLGHSGRYSKPTGQPRPVIAHHNPVVDMRQNLPADYPLASDEELDALQEDYERVARLAQRAGFDGVDIKAVHGYLLGELLGADRRPGRYGGSYENRARMFRQVVGRIAQRCPGLLLASRLTGCEPAPYPFGWGVAAKEGVMHPDLTEPLALVRELARLGVALFAPSLGWPRLQPYLNRPYDRALVGEAVPPEHPLEGIVRLAEVCRRFQEAAPAVPMTMAGLGWLRHLMPTVAAGLLAEGWASLVGQGRGALAYPDSVRDVLATGEMKPERCCITCSMCSQIMRDGVGRTGCVVRDGEIYAAEYRAGRAAATGGSAAGKVTS